MASLSCKVNGETYDILPQTSRDGKRLCGSRWCEYCRCHLRTSSGCRKIGELHELGYEWQGVMAPCTEPCKVIKDKFRHFCELGECYFRKTDKNKKEAD